MVPKRDAYLRIKDLIFTNEIPPGSHLVERQLAERLEISRVPVREALQRMVHEGLLVYVPGRGLVTRTYDEQELIDLYHYREPLEGMAARLFCQRGDDTEIELLSQIYTGMERLADAGDLDALHRNDFEFHLAIARGSRNERLAAELGELCQESQYVTKTAFTPKTGQMKDADLKKMRATVLAEHREIYEAIARRDADAAELAARYSIRAGLKRFMEIATADRLKSLRDSS